MGFFRDTAESPPPVVMNDYQPPSIGSQIPTVNFLEAFDAISGEQVSFVRGVDGERYLDIKSRYDAAKKIADSNELHGVGEGDPYRQQANNLKQQLDTAKSEQEQKTGLKSGEIRLSFKDLSGKPPIDAPIDYNDVNTNLPAVQNLPAFNMRYAAAVSNLTATLRQFGNTIDTINNTNPELIAANQGLINSYKAANQQALNRNFDIKKSGLDLELTKRGLSSSSTAIGAQINLLRERQEAQVNNNFKEAAFAQGLKQEQLQNMFNLGNQMVNEAGIELNQYSQESRNELVARGQDQDQDRIRQEQAARQVQFNLAKNEQIINGELGRRHLRLAQQSNRNLPALAAGFASNANQQALGAAGLDVQANLGVQQNQLSQSSLNLQRHQYEQASKPDFWGNLLATGAGAAVGAATGGTGIGGYLGNFAGASLFGKENKPEPQKITYNKY